MTGISYMANVVRQGAAWWWIGAARNLGSIAMRFCDSTPAGSSISDGTRQSTHTHRRNSSVAWAVGGVEQGAVVGRWLTNSELRRIFVGADPRSSTPSFQHPQCRSTSPTRRPRPPTRPPSASARPRPASSRTRRPRFPGRSRCSPATSRKRPGPPTRPCSSSACVRAMMPRRSCS